MGFMDKAKKFADQAQSKLDEVQKQFNESQGSQSGATGSNTPAVEYDQHGRRVTSSEDPSLRGSKAETTDSEPPHGDPLAQPSPANAPDTAPEPVAPAPDPERPHGDPLLDDAPKAPKPPSGGGMTSGDPLAG